MTLKELAHSAQQYLQTRAGCEVKRSHVHELLAAAFGHRSWAAFLSSAVLADNAAGAPPDSFQGQIVGRALQLRYPQPAAAAIAAALTAFITEHGVSSLSWSELATLAAPPAEAAEHEHSALDDDDDWDDDETEAAIPPSALTRQRMLQSPLLLNCLEQAAASSNARAHHVLAILYRCGRPNPYLYEESLKGRQLTSAERAWVDEYLVLAPQFVKYEAHLRAAALAGIRRAALEYATEFENQEFFELAERLQGDIDPMQMAHIARTSQSREKWVRSAAAEGSRSALEQLARQYDDLDALTRLAESGDRYWLRAAMQRALEEGDAPTAWKWHYLALGHGIDMTKSTMAAYHDGGDRDGKFYDSDFGGPMYAAGDEALELPDLPSEGREVAIAKAREIFTRSIGGNSMLRN